MQATGVRRVVVVSAAPVGTVPSPGHPKPHGTTPATGSSCRTGSAVSSGRRSAGTTPTRADGGPPVRQRPGLDRGPAAPADRQAAERRLPDGVRAERPRRLAAVAGRCRPPDYALHLAGLLPVVCPVGDGSGVTGISVFDASPEDVDRIMANDPGVRAGVFSLRRPSTRSFPGEQSPVIGPGETGAPARRHLLGGLHQRQGRAWMQRGRRRRAARRLRQSDVAA
jgi:hypothetical protein